MFNQRERRDADFMEAVGREMRRALASETGEGLTQRRVICRAMRSAAPGYYVERDRALTKLRRLRDGRQAPDGNPERRALWADLLEAWQRCCREHPRLSELLALDRVLTQQPAPRFYMSGDYAEKLFYHLQARHRRTARRRLEQTLAPLGTTADGHHRRTPRSRGNAALSPLNPKP